MRKRKHGKLGFFIPREWLVRAMQHWAREVQAAKREKEIEIKELKERNRELESQINKMQRMLPSH
jgi:hypothetical protein